MRDIRRVWITLYDYETNSRVSNFVCLWFITNRQVDRHLSQFATEVDNLIDHIQDFNKYIVKTLEKIVERQRNSLKLSTRVAWMISSFVVFDRSRADIDDERVKNLFIISAIHHSKRVNRLVDDSLDLDQSLDVIQENLDRIKKFVIKKIDDLLEKNILNALWTHLAHVDDSQEYILHNSLLMNMIEFYRTFSHLMKQTTAALIHVTTKLNEFRDDFVKSKVSLMNHSFEVIIALFRKTDERLKAANRKLEHIKQKERSQRKKIRETYTTTTFVMRTWAVYFSDCFERTLLHYLRRINSLNRFIVSCLTFAPNRIVAESLCFITVPHFSDTVMLPLLQWKIVNLETFFMTWSIVQRVMVSSLFSIFSNRVNRLIDVLFLTERSSLLPNQILQS